MSINIKCNLKLEIDQRLDPSEVNLSQLCCMKDDFDKLGTVGMNELLCLKNVGA